MVYEVCGNIVFGFYELKGLWFFSVRVLGFVFVSEVWSVDVVVMGYEVIKLWGV